MEFEELVQIVIGLGYTSFDSNAERKTIGLGYSSDGVEEHNFNVWLYILNSETMLLRANSVACGDCDPLKFREMCLYINQFQAESPIKWFMSKKGHVMGEQFLFDPTESMIERALSLMMVEFATHIGELVETFELTTLES